MTTQTHRLPCDDRARRPAAGWLARLGRLFIEAHREGFVSRAELDIRLLNDINAPQVQPTSDELRDAYRRWFGGDPTRHL